MLKFGANLNFRQYRFGKGSHKPLLERVAFRGQFWIGHVMIISESMESVMLIRGHRCAALGFANDAKPKIIPLVVQQMDESVKVTEFSKWNR